MAHKPINKTDNIYLTFIGLLSLIMLILDISLKSRNYGEYRFLWFCTLGLLMIAFACFTKKPELVYLFLSIGLIVQIQWTLDLAYYLFTGNYLTGNSAVVFEAGHTMLDFVNSMRHLFMLPLALITAYILPKPEMKKIGMLALIGGLIVIPASFYFGSDSTNLNCTQVSCLGFDMSWEYLPLLLVVVLSFVSILFIAPLLVKWKEKRPKSIIAVSQILIVVAVFLSVGSLIEYKKVDHYSCNYKINEYTYCEGVFFDYGRDSNYLTLRFEDKKGGECLIEIKYKDYKSNQKVDIISQNQKLISYLWDAEDAEQINITSNCT